MEQHKSPRRYRILVTISVLFTSLVILFGLFFREFIFRQTSSMILEESKRLFGQINRELSLEYLMTHKTISQTVHILGSTSLSSATTLEERLSFLPVLQAALVQAPKLVALQIGYSTGDYFIVRPLANDSMRKQFSAPPDADLVTDNITRSSDGTSRLQRFWFSRELVEISRSIPEATNYDPRLRPWYLEAIASEKEIVTEPYLFHFIRQMGLTIAFMPQMNTAVIAGDVTLYHLSKTLADYWQTPRSELILLDKKDDAYWVTAYKDPNKLIRMDEGGPKRIKAIELDSPVINYAATLPNILEPLSSFSFDNEKWLRSTSKFKLAENENLYLVMLSPENELLQEAKRLQEQTLRYTLLMIFFSVPITYLLAKKISKPIQALALKTKRLSQFEFEKRNISHSSIKEVDELGQAMAMMESTIGQFLSLIKSLASEQNFDQLLELITQETMTVSEADAAFTYIVEESTNELEPRTIKSKQRNGLNSEILLDMPKFPLEGNAPLVQILSEGKGAIWSLQTLGDYTTLTSQFNLQSPQAYVQPLINRQGDSIGILCLVYSYGGTINTEKQQGRLAFIEALSGFAAVTLESRKMLKMQKALLDSFIQLLAGAIDSKSPYTGGHCQRVPVLTEILARKACESTDGPFADYSLTDQEWEAIKIASWLHDCGKITTPEFVVDKATKLETIYDRIHEIRMRFEVLKRDAHISYWQQIAYGGDRKILFPQLEAQWRQLDEDFHFVAECNLGGEVMSPEKIDRLGSIATRCWKRTLDDRIGISWEELQRKQPSPVQPLPVTEQLLANREDHLFLRSKKDRITPDNDYGFHLNVPQYLYNKGELYNLSISRGTLTPEERYKTNDHIVQSIIMLKQLSYPKHLMEVPDIAGSHHEKIDGTGYPRCLRGNQMSIPAKMMAIADIFEALTASDRPYKKAKTISEAISIMRVMEKDKHIDPNLFRLFLESGVYLEYARQYLQPYQIDTVDLGN